MPEQAPPPPGVIQRLKDAKAARAAAVAAEDAARSALAHANEIEAAASTAARDALAAQGPRLIRLPDGGFEVWETMAGDPGYRSFPIAEGDIGVEPPEDEEGTPP